MSVQKDVSRGVVLEINKAKVKSHSTVVVMTQFVNGQEVVMQLTDMMNATKT